MSTALFKRWFKEVWNESRDATIDELFAPDGIAYGLPGELRGPDGFRTFRDAFQGAFPEIHIEVEEALEGPPARDGTVTVAARMTAQVATPEGRRGVLPFMCWSRWRSGKIVESWNACDFLALEKQVGKLPL